MYYKQFTRRVSYITNELVRQPYYSAYPIIPSWKKGYGIKTLSITGRLDLTTYFLLNFSFTIFIYKLRFIIP